MLKCNMKKISKLFSLLICIVMMSSLFVGCKSQTSEINFLTMERTQMMKL